MRLLHNLIGVLGLITISYCAECGIQPEGVIKLKNKNDIDRYIIYIPGNPKTYTPHQKYNVSLRVNPNKNPQKAFKQFLLTVESINPDEDVRTYRPTGQLELELNSQFTSRFSESCENIVVENSKMPKWEIQVYWIAPPAGSGCVAIKATVIESRENWFSEDGQLTKILCEDSEINENVKPPMVVNCCACSEAKYEVAFEGRWTRNTHPRNYPSNIWTTKFSDIIGASHRKYHSFWYEQDYASEGLKDLAENGNTQKLEGEIKVMGRNIRTIIKARGLQYPNITDTSYAVFRVDSSNHLVSLVSKITPSPDWFVGVSNFELCKSDCTWAESYTYNLYPMDAGTDDGIDYMSSNPLLFSHKVITPITQNNPNDPQSPFYDEDGNPMNPIAKVHFTRQRLYNSNKPCRANEDSSNSDDSNCATTKWSDWTPCSVPCGLGRKTRMRQYVNSHRAQECFVRLVQHQTCQGKADYCKHSVYRTSDEEPSEGASNEDDNKSEEDANGSNEDNKSGGEEDEGDDKHPASDSQCAVGEWSDWSSCSATCGKGTKTRDRRLIHPENEDQCSVALEDNEPCDGVDGKCDDQGESTCTNTNWGPWSSCSVSCGVGFKRRLLLPPDDKEHDSDEEGEENCPTSETVKCNVDCTETDKIGESLILEQRPDGRVRNCKVTDWSVWSRCEVRGRGKTCGTGSRKRSRQILKHPENGGRACPRKLLKTQTCHVPCPSGEDDGRSEESKGPVCIMSDWTDFTPCSSICGSNAMQLSTRKIIYKPPGAVCPSRVMYRPCNLPLACAHDGRPIFL